MTVISGYIKAVSGRPATGSITIAAARLRKNIDNTALIDRAPTRYPIQTNGFFTTDELDPGPARVIINTNGRQEIYDPVSIPPTPTADLYDVISEAIDYPPDVILEAQAARTAAEKARDRAVQAEALISGVVADGAAAIRAHVETQASRAEAGRAGAETAKSGADAAKTAAETAKTAAETARTAAQTARTGAETAKTGADTAKTAAETAKGLAETAKTGADAAKTAAETAKTAAETARTEAQTARTGAEAAKGLAEAAKTGADAAKAAAETARDAAQGFANAAEFKVRPGGWLETDLVQAVRDKLALAATALQSVSWGQVSGKPTTFTPSAHTHQITEVQFLQGVLDGMVQGENVTRIRKVTAAEYAALSPNYNSTTLYVVAG
ncbi:hypothetical protein GS982_01445 [Rhodococcus hoagii]|uniref:Minor tail protein n=1 Tax=Rhodococcus hoagii TaxID=43767 RepID=A0A9Q4ZIM6_RHOHA|nr:hypothetical protein [Prescottella equi]NKT77263.1 hypothetical protein [Prescottella equi]NKZ81048.1 hypothetical protein [Prescottella equi]